MAPRTAGSSGSPGERTTSSTNDGTTDPRVVTLARCSRLARHAEHMPPGSTVLPH
jgi:hypothetical protein